MVEYCCESNNWFKGTIVNQTRLKGTIENQQIKD